MIERKLIAKVGDTVRWPLWGILFILAGIAFLSVLKYQHFRLPSLKHHTVLLKGLFAVAHQPAMLVLFGLLTVLLYTVIWLVRTLILGGIGHLIWHHPTPRLANITGYTMIATLGQAMFHTLHIWPNWFNFVTIDRYNVSLFIIIGYGLLAMLIRAETHLPTTKICLAVVLDAGLSLSAIVLLLQTQTLVKYL